MRLDPKNCIRVRGAHEHNLKQVDVELPRDALIVVTGVSGSGKSSLAFDTLFREGQRCYLETFPSYARQLLGKLERPAVEQISGLSPALAVDQKTSVRNPRSTVGTMSELHPLLRLLFARLGEPRCAKCGQPLAALSPEQLAGQLLARFTEREVLLLAPLIDGHKGRYREELERAARDGFSEIRIDGRLVPTSPLPELDAAALHQIELPIARLVPRPSRESELRAAVERALRLGKGVLKVVCGEKLERFETARACASCGAEVPEIGPRLFSFNSPYGACPSCGGLGLQDAVDPELFVGDASKTLREGALVLTTPTGYIVYSQVTMEVLNQVCQAHGFSVDIPWKDLSDEQRRVVLYGSDKIKIPFGKHPLENRLKWKGITARPREEGTYKGIVPIVEEILKRNRNENTLRFVRSQPCTACQGARLRPEALAVRFRDRSIAELCALSLDALHGFFDEVAWRPNERAIGEAISLSVRPRLETLRRLGLGYLTLDRDAPSLSNGEAQRLRLATQVDNGLKNILYVLDEPSVGLHPRDTARLLEVLARLRDAGNTVLVVEHDEDTIRAADWVVEIGPDAGPGGGNIVSSGPARAAGETPALPEGRALDQLPLLWIRGAQHHNLKGGDVPFRIGALNLVTGVSGSGKSSLVGDILARALRQKLHGAHEPPGKHRALEGDEAIDKIIEIDQAPIGRTPRSNPATYAGLTDPIRDLFAALPESKARGWGKSRFSFNVVGGRCEACGGAGVQSIGMHFLADVDVVCESCGGRRFNEDTLEVKWRDRSIGDLLELTVAEALPLFEDVKAVRRVLEAMRDVGLGYLSLGQPATTLSGGEAQRVKLSSELGRVSTGRTLYVLDEPTTGLHARDVAMLLKALRGLVARGNTVIAVEHHLDLVRAADWVVDLGPEGGDEGGRLVASGTPAQIAACKASHTGSALRGEIALPLPLPSPSLRSGDGDREAPDTTAQASRAEADRHPLSEAKGRAGGGAAGGKSAQIAACTASHTGSALRGEIALPLPLPSPSLRSGDGDREAPDTTAQASRAEADRHPLSEAKGRAGGGAAGGKSAQIAACTASHTGSALRGEAALPLSKPAAEAAPIFAKPAFAGSAGIRLRGVTTHNLKGVDLDIPEGKLTVITGVSGSGKSSLAFDTLFHEGQRRFTASLSSFARRYVPRARPPELEEATGLSAPVAVGQHAAARNPRSTVGTVSEVYDDLRLVFSRAGTPRGRGLTARLFSFNHVQGACERCRGLGLTLSCDPEKLVTDPSRSLLDGALDGTKTGEFYGDRKGQHLAILEAVARTHGLELSRPWRELGARERDLAMNGTGEQIYEATWRWERKSVEGEHVWKTTWKGFVGYVDEEYQRKHADERGEAMLPLMREIRCDACQGERLKPELRAVRFADRTMGELCRLPLSDLAAFLEGCPERLSPDERAITGDARAQALGRLHSLCEVGLPYLTLDRTASSLSGGELQRLRLATQLGSGLRGVTYVLDEPTVGLHPRDTKPLLKVLRRLCDEGNTVVVVEHDPELMRAADRLVDLGPGAGKDGGRIVVAGSLAEVCACAASATGRYLEDPARMIPVPKARRAPEPGVRIEGASANNLRLDCEIPARALVAVTGVSGSGKSSLVFDVLLASAQARRAVGCARIEGLERFREVVFVDQAALAGGPLSTPATFVGAFDGIRELFTHSEIALARQWKKSRFSLSAKGGRCEACQGSGRIEIRMDFLPDVHLPCEACRGARYGAETLEATWRGKNIAEVLGLTCEEALGFFHGERKIVRPLSVLCEAGLGYLALGQPTSTLSGGEAQRLRLASELCAEQQGEALYLFDEPTTGLHPKDVANLLRVLGELVARGHSVVVVEHHLDVIKSADHVLDLGPEGGGRGGRLVAAGTPEAIAASPASATGEALRSLL